MPSKKIQEILGLLDRLNALQEQLLSVPDDMLLEINPRDNESLDSGVKFIKAYNDNINIFCESARVVENQLKEHFKVNPEEQDIIVESADRQKRERIIAELDKETAYSLDDNFTYKTPYGFILGNTAVKGLKTWRSLYLHILEHLQKADKERFETIPDQETLVSNRGNFYFTRNISDVRYPHKINDNFYIEFNLSANNIRNNIKMLLEYFQIDSSALKIYLSKDRDA